MYCNYKGNTVPKSIIIIIIIIIMYCNYILIGILFYVRPNISRTTRRTGTPVCMLCVLHCNI